VEKVVSMAVNKVEIGINILNIHRKLPTIILEDSNKKECEVNIKIRLYLIIGLEGSIQILG